MPRRKRSAAEEADRYARRHLRLGFIFTFLAVPIPVVTYWKDGKVMEEARNWMTLATATVPHFIFWGLEGLFIGLALWSFRRMNYYQTRHLDRLDHQEDNGTQNGRKAEEPPSSDIDANSEEGEK